MDKMEQKIDEYFKEISKGDYEKFESLILNDYEEVRNLYFILKDYSCSISTIDYECDVEDNKDIARIVIHTIEDTLDIKDIICASIPELHDIDISGNIINICIEEY